MCKRNIGVTYMGHICLLYYAKTISNIACNLTIVARSEGPNLHTI
jgi:hypothetical protein